MSFPIFGRPGGHPDYFENLSRAKDPEPSACCVYCGRYVKAPSVFVFLNIENEPVDAEEGQKAPEWMGLYPIGPDCAKKAKAAGVQLYDSECKLA